MTGRSSRGLPSLGLISHGTSSTEGQALIEALAAEVARDLRERGLVDEVMLGHVDVQEPSVAEVVDRLPHDRPVILVPLLLSPGYHVHVDLAEAIDQAQTADRDRDAVTAGNAGAGRAGTPVRDIRLTRTLGPDPRLARILAKRLPALRDDDEIVLAAAGSSDERANESCREMGELLAIELGRPVTVRFLAGVGASLRDAVEQSRERENRLVLANYLLAPGFFDDLARGLIAGTQNVLSSPLLTPDDRLRSSDSAPLSAAGTHDPSRYTVPDLLVDIVRERLSPPRPADSSVL